MNAHTLQSALAIMARDEARQRARRTGRPDRPGGLPGDLNVGGAPRIADVELRFRVMAMLAIGPATRTAICEACGNQRRMRDLLDSLTAQGVLTLTVEGKTMTYEAVK